MKGSFQDSEKVLDLYQKLKKCTFQNYKKNWVSEGKVGIVGISRRYKVGYIKELWGEIHKITKF